MSIIKNKKADIPVAILVIGVFAICTLAILSFNLSLSKNAFSTVGPSVIEDVKSIEEKILFYKSQNINFESLLNSKKDDGGNFDLEVKKEGNSYIIIEKFENSKTGLVFKVEYTFNP